MTWSNSRCVPSASTIDKVAGTLRVPSAAGPKNSQPPRVPSALIRLMEEKDLYTEDDSGVVFIGRSLFRATVALPTTVPTGRFLVEVYLFRDGELSSRTKGSLEVNKAGMEAVIYNLAFQRPFLYGLVGIAIAVLAGLLGWFAFRSD